MATDLAHHFRDQRQQHAAATLGMWIFLATEVMVFGALFTGYTAYRAKYPQEFAAASGELNLTLGAINTVVLLTSSLTMALAVRGAQLGQRKLLVNALALTALLGAAFLVIKAFEYREDFEKNLVPGLAFRAEDWLGRGVDSHRLDPRYVQLFLLFYYIMTGLHALHLIIGIGIILILVVAAARGRFSPGYHSPVEVGGLYWHFVDVVWIFLLPLLYLIGTRGG